MKTLNIRKFLLYFFTFFALYLPDFSYCIKLSGFIILIALLLLYIVLKVGSNKNFFNSYLKDKNFVLFIFLFIISTMYYLCRTLQAGTAITDFMNLRIMQGLSPIVYLLIFIIVFDELEAMKYSKKDKYKFIINVGLIQSFFAIAMVVFPPFKNIAINIFNHTHATNIYITNLRLYGINNTDYTYSLQLLHSILALFSLWFSIYYKEKKYVLYSILLFVVTILNGRTGILVYAVGILYILLTQLYTKNGIIKFFKYSIILLVAVFIGYQVILRFLPNTYTLVEHAVNDVLNFANDSGTKTESGALAESLIFPYGIYLIIGHGYHIEGGKGRPYGHTRRSSDSGFSNQAFMGGLLYIFLLFYPYYNLMRKIKLNCKDKKGEWQLINLLVISFIICNIKGNVFTSYSLISIFTCLILFMYLDIVKEKRGGKICKE